MAERTENLYHRVKKHLAITKGIHFVGEVFSYPIGQGKFSLDEEIRFFVTPLPEIPFNSTELNSFRDRIKITGKNVISIESVWHELLLKDGGTTMALHFPVLLYSEELKGYEDLLDPPACLRYLAKRHQAPALNPLYSRREVYVQIYPRGDYASQIYDYQSGLAEGRFPDETMDFLTHSISQEQVEQLQHSPRYAFKLRHLPAAPQVIGRRGN